MKQNTSTFLETPISEQPSEKKPKSGVSPNDLSFNVWGIKEYEQAGESCPIIPTNLPWYKKFALFFFRFGVCPMCVTMSLGYNISKFFGRKIKAK